MAHKKTKIVCTLGPSSDSLNEILSLIKAGMNVARLNFSHGDYKDHAKIIKNLREAEKISGTGITLMQDLQGPKIRITDLKNNQNQKELSVKKGEELLLIKSPTLSVNFLKKKKEEIIKVVVDYKKLDDEVKKNHSVIMNDGEVIFKVIATKPLKIKALTSGKMKIGNGVNFPDSKISLPAITEKDKRDLAFGIKNGIDVVALSFVESAKDIKNLRALTKLPIIAKIERKRAIENLKEIIKESDGVMVARGDLGTDIAPELVPIVQKRIINLANIEAKPVITATEVLKSMIKNSRPTRAEISDAANAVFDLTDAIMLSNESAVGKYAAKSTEMLTKVSLVVEKEMDKYEELFPTFAGNNLSNLEKACLEVIKISQEKKLKKIIVYCAKNLAPKIISKYRPSAQIFTIIKDVNDARLLNLTWGLSEFIVSKNPQSDAKEIFAKEKKSILLISEKDANYWY